MTRKRDAVDARFDPILAAMDAAKARFNLLAGENIYMLTFLLFGSIQDAPEYIRELFRGAVVQTLLRERDSGYVLKQLCLEGTIDRPSMIPQDPAGAVRREPRYFRPVCPSDCRHPNDGHHHHRGQFEAYWKSLTAREQQSLRDKANWEHMTLSAVASEWGAIHD